MSLAGLLFLLYRIARHVFERRRRLPPRYTSRSHTEELPPEEDLGAAYARHLESGHAAAALRALWLLVMRRLVHAGYGRFDPEMTNREFVATVRRGSPRFPTLALLTRLSARTDHLFYSGEECSVDDVRVVAAESEELLTAEEAR